MPLVNIIRTPKPGIRALDPSLVLCGLARVGLYMPVYHANEEVRVCGNEIRFIDNDVSPGVPWH